ncbi:acyl dehydratase [Jiangella mangrovi]|uniref:Acyl dehydratase n=1 Tax=Jiangella mangrovi TaxID=1524084 RepID=A0A7W9LPX6_9ACTN|nr:acyl dehydratase [Jiangella mangrovi]MBB5791667.1 acyl dehydratase [Jiangella mangrovi]
MTVLTEVVAGVTLPPYRLRTSTVRLFRFSAVTWNAHRIHYDAEYARSEGYPDVLVQSHLHGCVLLNAVLAWAGPGVTLRSFGWQNRGIAVAGDELIVTGEVVEVRDAPGERVAELRLEERRQDGELCAPGHVTVAWPAGPAGPDGPAGP